MNKKIIIKILLLFLVWRTALFLIAFASIYFLPDFGARFPYYQDLLVSTKLPYWFWGFANFDGVHYLTIAKSGYIAQYTQAFFPLYPFLMNILNLSNSLLITGIVISNLTFLASMFVLYKLFNLDFDEKISFKSLVLLVAFPTAYYFASLYTESLFLLLSVLCIFFTRKKLFLWAGVFGFFAALTKLMGILLIIILIAEFYNFVKNKELKHKFLNLLGIILVPLGTACYMIYLKIYFNDPFYFLNAQPAFGAERTSTSLIFLPQVLFRYIKIFITVPFNTLPFFNALLEFSFTVIPLVLLIVLFKKSRFSYWVFSLLILIIPTLTGTLSSMPRYALMIFLLFPQVVNLTGRLFWITVLLLSIFEAILLTMFIRGYWIA